MSQAKNLFDQFISGGIDSISNLIGQEENDILEFKRKTNPDSASAKWDEKDKYNYGKALSGFANGSGGVIVWGVIAEGGKVDIGIPDVACNLQPIKHIKNFLNLLNNNVACAIDPGWSGIQNAIIYSDEAEETGYVLTFVPESPHPPHRSGFCGGRYFLRQGSSSVQMSHSTLALFFGKRQRPHLELIHQVECSGDAFASKPFAHVIVRLEILNTGRYLATYPGIKINLSSNLRLSEYEVDGNRNSVLHTRLQFGTANSHCLVGGLDTPIYPGTSIAAAKIRQESFSIDLVDFVRYHSNQPSIWGSIEYELYCEGVETKTGRIEIMVQELLEQKPFSDMFQMLFHH